MKTTLLLLIAGLFLTPACPPQSFKITGEIKNFSGDTVQLSIAKVHMQPPEIVKIFVENGTFHYEGEAASPYHSTLVVDKGVRIPFILYNEKIHIIADAKNPRTFSIKGGPQCDQYNEYLHTIQSQAFDSLYVTMRKEANALPPESPEAKILIEKATAIQNEKLIMSEAFIRKYPQSGTSAYLFWEIYMRMPKNEAFALFDVINGDVLADNSYYKFFSSNIIGQRNTEVGLKVPSMSQNTPDGDKVSLDDFRGNYLLIDFWASWCMPCREANPDMVDLYNKFKDNNFTILGISLDGDKERWVEAIEKDNLPWRHVSDLKAWDNEIARAFGITSIPTTVLVDPDGVIIGRYQSIDELETALAKIFNSPPTSTP